MSDALVIANGRVVDPRNGVDGVRSLLLRDGKVAQVSEAPIDAPNVERLGERRRGAVDGQVGAAGDAFHGSGRVGTHGSPLN
jgi:dihydroorotase